MPWAACEKHKTNIHESSTWYNQGKSNNTQLLDDTKSQTLSAVSACSLLQTPPPLRREFIGTFHSRTSKYAETLNMDVSKSTVAMQYCTLTQDDKSKYADKAN